MANEEVKRQDDVSPYHFHCERRDMLVSKDITDCMGCPMKVYPTPCKQYGYWKKEAQNDIYNP